MKAGDKVVCIRNNFRKGANTSHFSIPIVNQVYVVYDFFDYKGHYYISLVGFDKDAGFDVDFFRKIDESFADSVLEKITEQIKEEELELI